MFLSSIQVCVCVLDDPTPHRQPHWINVKLGLTWFDQPKKSFQMGIEHDWTKKIQKTCGFDQEKLGLHEQTWGLHQPKGPSCRLPGILISPAVSDLTPTNCYGIIVIYHIWQVKIRESLLVVGSGGVSPLMLGGFACLRLSWGQIDEARMKPQFQGCRPHERCICSYTYMCIWMQLTKQAHIHMYPYDTN